LHRDPLERAITSARDFGSRSDRLSPLTRMTSDLPTLKDGDRVRAKHRVGFPDGTVMKILEGGFVLVRWDSNVLETAHARELTRIETPSDGN
jgi:hypothetical protein